MLSSKIYSLTLFLCNQKCQVKTMTISLPISFLYVTHFSPPLCLHIHNATHFYIYFYTRIQENLVFYILRQHKEHNIYNKSTTRPTARTRFRMGLQIPLYQQPERHYERRATPPQPDRTSKICLI